MMGAIGFDRKLLLMGVLSVFALGAVSDTLFADDRLLDRWKKKTEKADALLLKGKWNKAEIVVRSLAEDIKVNVVGGGANWLGVVSLMRAVAAAGQGNEHEAFWYWDMTLQLSPTIDERDVKRYGKPGELLLSHEHPPVQEKKGEKVLPDDPRLQPPRKIRSPPPDFPVARRLSGTTVSLVIETQVDVKGTLSHPTIIQSQGEFTMVYSVLEALREWRFKPARFDGKPIEFTYELKLNFKNPY